MQKWFKKLTNNILSIVRNMAIVFFTVLLLLSCTSSSKEETSAKTESSVEDAAPLPAEQPNGSTKIHVVEIKQMKFQPENIIVRKGDSVQWINRDITNHDVTEQSTNAWASSPLKTGESWGMVVTESVDYYCNLHQVMKGKITVAP
jgi:plastocyanin